MSKSNADQQGTKENPRAPLRHLRAVGRLEWFLFARTKARADSCIIVAARYTPSHSGDVINKAALYPALGEVVRNNVALASRIAPASDRRGPPGWVRLPSLDLDRVVEFINDDFSDLESIFESQFRRGFDPDTDLPLWRLAVLRDGTLLFAFDHALCDGLGGLAFHRMLLAALQENRTSPTSVQFVENQNLPPPLEDATHVSIPWRTVFRETLKLFNPIAWRRYFATWAGNRIPASFEFDTRVHILTYCPAEAQRLTSLAHAHKATLTATLHTLALLVLSRLLNKHSHGKFKSTRTYVPLSLRRATGASANDFCNHYSYLFSEHKLFSGPVLRFGENEGDGAESFPWADAAQFTHKMREATPHAASAMGLLKLVGSPGRRWGFVRRPLGHRRVIGIEVSNLGSFSLGLGEEEEVEMGEEEEELEGRRAIEVVPTPAVAVAETVKSQDADRAVGDASAVVARGAETRENAPPTAVPAERTDTSQTAGGDERFATPPETPISTPAPVAQIGTQDKGKGRARETIDDVPPQLLPLAGDKEVSASPHGSDLAQDAPTTSGGPLTEGEHDALNNNNVPAPESEDKDTTSEPESANVDMSISSPESARNVVVNVDDHEDEGTEPAHGTMPAKEAQAVGPLPAPAVPHTADVQTEAPPPPARGRTISEAASNNNTNTNTASASPRARDRLPSEPPPPHAKPELELVSPHCRCGGADPPRAEAPHPTSPTYANANRDPAPTGNARKPAVANSPPPDNDAPRGPGQARRVGNAIPTQAQEPRARLGHQDPLAATQTQPLWTLREVLHAQADGTLGAALKVCATGTPAGGLGVAISWGASAVDEEFGKAFVVGFADGLRELTIDVDADVDIGGEPRDGEQ